MKNSPLIFILLTAFALAPVIARADDPFTLPFPVSIGGQAAAIKGDAATATFALIEKPVAANAALEVDVKADMIICNIVAADEKGAPKEGASPAVLLIQGGNKTTLDKTMGDVKFAPGSYMIAVVAEGKTATVLFKIQ